VAVHNSRQQRRLRKESIRSTVPELQLPAIPDRTQTPTGVAPDQAPVGKTQGPGPTSTESENGVR
jgi:hypothetical protein